MAHIQNLTQCLLQLHCTVCVTFSLVHTRTSEILRSSTSAQSDGHPHKVRKFFSSPGTVQRTHTVLSLTSSQRRSELSHEGQCLTKVSLPRLRNCFEDVLWIWGWDRGTEGSGRWEKGSSDQKRAIRVHGKYVYSTLACEKERGISERKDCLKKGERSSMLLCTCTCVNVHET